MKEKIVLSYTNCPMNQVKMIQLIYAPYWDAMPNVYPKLYHSVLTEEIPGSSLTPSHLCGLSQKAPAMNQEAGPHQTLHLPVP